MKDSYLSESEIVHVSHSENDQIMEIVGINVKTSFIVSNIKLSTKFIRIVTYYSLTFDSDMTTISGVSISIVSNMWSIVGNKTVNMSGDGSSAVSIAGTSSGHFRMLVNHVQATNSGKLTINANGGDGAAGSRGQPGEPITSRASDTSFPSSRPSIPNRDPDRSTWSAFGGFKVYIIYQNDFSQGYKGNKGMDGGNGGDSGPKGDVWQKKTFDNVIIINKDGAPGLGGDGGEGSQGQENGYSRRCALVVHHNEIEWKDEGLGSSNGYGPTGDKGNSGASGKVLPQEISDWCSLSKTTDVAKAKKSLYENNCILSKLCDKLIELLV
jgi:hypothetical protein